MKIINYNTMSEAQQVVLVGREAYFIRGITNPSEAVCVAAVTQDYLALEYIQNPSEAVCIAAVNMGYDAIEHIQNPSEAVQIEAVKFHPAAIAFVPRPTPNTVIAAHLIYHPYSPHTPQAMFDRAPELLDNHCPGLGEIYTIGLSIGMDGKDLSETMIEWIENHAVVAVVNSAGMAP